MYAVLRGELRGGRQKEVAAASEEGFHRHLRSVQKSNGRLICTMRNELVWRNFVSLAPVEIEYIHRYSGWCDDTVGESLEPSLFDLLSVGLDMALAVFVCGHSQKRLVLTRVELHVRTS